MIHRDQEIGRRKREQTQKTPCEPYAAHYQDEIFCVCDIREEKTQTQLPVILQGNGREMWCFPRADDFQWIVCCLLLLLLYTPTYKPTRTHILEIDIKKKRGKKKAGTIQYRHTHTSLVDSFLLLFFRSWEREEGCNEGESNSYCRKIKVLHHGRDLLVVVVVGGADARRT